MALIDEDYLRISLRSEWFRICFEVPFRAVFGLSLIAAVGTAWFFSRGDVQFVTLGLVIPVATGVLAAIGIYILKLRYQFQITPVGLTCYDFWGRQRMTPWESIKFVRRFDLFGLSYLRIGSDHQRSEIWLPLFVERFDLLLDLVEAHVSQKHPLYVGLKLADKSQNS